MGISDSVGLGWAPSVRLTRSQGPLPLGSLWSLLCPTPLIFHHCLQTEPPTLGGRHPSPPASPAPRWSQATVLRGLAPAQATVGQGDDAHRPW